MLEHLSLHQCPLLSINASWPISIRLWLTIIFLSFFMLGTDISNSITYKIPCILCYLFSASGYCPKWSLPTIIVIMIPSALLTALHHSCNLFVNTILFKMYFYSLGVLFSTLFKHQKSLTNLHVILTQGP